MSKEVLGSIPSQATSFQGHMIYLNMLEYMSLHCSKSNVYPYLVTKHINHFSYVRASVIQP